VVQIFEKGELFFAHPSTWDDPYEHHNHKYSNSLFAQCWSRIAISDAMWRIYSPNHLGVRVRTTPQDLSNALQTFIHGHRHYSWVSRQVEYHKQTELKSKFQVLRGRIDKDMSNGAELLYHKRDAFAHESEWRASIFCSEEGPKDITKGLRVKINPHEFIGNMFLDPRAPDELVKAFRYYLKVKLKFKGGVAKSGLYKAPDDE
jgi:hypothetical protein